MNREQLLQQMICLLLVTLFVLSVIGCGAMQSLFATPAPAPISPQPGEWIASAESLGKFVFKVAPDSTVVTLASFHLAGCGRVFLCSTRSPSVASSTRLGRALMAPGE